MLTSEIYKNILRDINSLCYVVSPRGQKVREVIDYSTFVQNPLNLAFDFASRKISRKYLAAELLWYLSGDRKTNEVGKYASMRSRISDDEGYVNSNYGYITLYKEIDDYGNQYDYVVRKLMEDKDSRQALIRYNSHEHVYRGNKDFVCTISNQFFIRADKIHMIVNMRSNDAFYGFQYDVVWFGLLLQSVYLDLKGFHDGLQLGAIYYHAGSMHIYENMFDASEKIIEERKGVDYNVVLTKSLKEIKMMVSNNIDEYRTILMNAKNYKKFIEDILYISIKQHEGV